MRNHTREEQNRTTSEDRVGNGIEYYNETKLHSYSYQLMSMGLIPDVNTTLEEWVDNHKELIDG